MNDCRGRSPPAGHVAGSCRWVDSVRRRAEPSDMTIYWQMRRLR